MTVYNKTENNNLSGNPLFVSSTDFNLQPGSPAINKGVDVGEPFNGSAPDIGAFETGISPVVDNLRPVVSAFIIPSTSASLSVPACRGSDAPPIPTATLSLR